MSVRYGVQAAPTFEESLEKCGAGVVWELGMQLTMVCWTDGRNPDSIVIIEHPGGFYQYDFKEN